jgi:hypothetical protein
MLRPWARSRRRFVAERGVVARFFRTFDQATAPARSLAVDRLSVPIPQRGHVGLDPGLVDEDQTPRIEIGLPRSPASPPMRDVGAALLKGEQRFF